MKNKNALKPHIIAALIAIYTEKGYYLQVIRLLLTGKRVTTYKQKGYYLQAKGLLLTANTLICITSLTYKSYFP